MMNEFLIFFLAWTTLAYYNLDWSKNIRPAEAGGTPEDGSNSVPISGLVASWTVVLVLMVFPLSSAPCCKKGGDNESNMKIEEAEAEKVEDDDDPEEMYYLRLHGPTSTDTVPAPTKSKIIAGLGLEAFLKENKGQDVTPRMYAEQLLKCPEKKKPKRKPKGKRRQGADAALVGAGRVKGGSAAAAAGGGGGGGVRQAEAGGAEADDTVLMEKDADGNWVAPPPRGLSEDPPNVTTLGDGGEAPPEGAEDTIPPGVHDDAPPGVADGGADEELPPGVGPETQGDDGMEPPGIDC
jgi:hypothetical protein